MWAASFQLCSFLTPALDGYEWSASCSCLFHPGGDKALSSTMGGPPEPVLTLWWKKKLLLSYRKWNHVLSTAVALYSKTNQMHNISNLFYFGTTCYMFRTVSPSIIRSLRLYIQHQVYVIQVLWLQQAATEPVWHIPDAVCTVLDSWWWTERPPEACRGLFQNKINLRYCTSGWFYYRNILEYTVLQTSNLLYPCF